MFIFKKIIYSLISSITNEIDVMLTEMTKKLSRLDADEKLLKIK
jgi:hypothetical protein